MTGNGEERSTSICEAGVRQLNPAEGSASGLHASSLRQPSAHPEGAGRRFGAIRAVQSSLLAPLASLPESNQGSLGRLGAGIP